MTLSPSAALIAALAVLQASAPTPDVGVDGPLASAGRYVESFRDAFRVVISVERYRQRMRRTEERDGRAVGSRFNLGNISRNFSDPTLVLRCSASCDRYSGDIPKCAIR